MAFDSSSELGISPESSESAETRPNFTKIFLKSFEYSQGSSSLQSDIFRYIHYMNPEWRISPDEKEKIIRDATSSITAMFTRDGWLMTSSDFSQKPVMHKKLHADDISKEVQEEMDKMEIVLNDTDTPHDPLELANLRKWSVIAITQDILTRDHRFLVEVEKGRPRSGPVRQERFDPYLSQLRFYAGEGHATGIPEFNQMFREVKEIVQANIHPKKWRNMGIQEGLHKNFLRSLGEVSDVWEEKYPGKEYLAPFRELPERSSRLHRFWKKVHSS